VRSCFHLLAGAANDQDAFARAFVWLKRRIEETGSTGYLAIPSPGFLQTEMPQVLGLRLVEVLAREGRLRLGRRLGMRVAAVDGLGGGRAPVAALAPGVLDLPKLMRRRGPVLVVTPSDEVIDQWVRETRSVGPRPEKFL
jgi:hypothetical protein